MRPTPPHLTSAAAESLLAQACENESQNAKRMRLGLEPLPVSRFENYAKRVSPIGNTYNVSNVSVERYLYTFFRFLNSLRSL